MHPRPAVKAAPAVDLNAQIAGLLRDLAAIQVVKAKSFGYKRAASAVLWLPHQIDQLREAGTWPKIPGLGPASMVHRQLHVLVCEPILPDYRTGSLPDAHRQLQATWLRLAVIIRQAWSAQQLCQKMFGIVRSGRSQIFVRRDHFFGHSAATDGAQGRLPLTRFQSLLPTGCTGVRQFSIVRT